MPQFDLVKLRSGALPHTWYRHGAQDPSRSVGQRVDWFETGVDSPTDAAGTAATGGTFPGTSTPLLTSEVHLFGGGQGLRVSRYGFEGGAQDRPKLGKVMAWSDPFQVHQRRFISSGALAGSGATPDQDAAGNPVAISIAFPAARLYRSFWTTSQPSGLGAGVGTFTTVNGVSEEVLILFPDVREWPASEVFGDPGGAQYLVTEIYEWRTAPGWTIHEVDDSGQVVTLNLRDEVL